MSAPRWLLLHGVPTGGRYWDRLQLPGTVLAPDLEGYGTLLGKRPAGIPSGLLEKRPAGIPSRGDGKARIDDPCAMPDLDRTLVEVEGMLSPGGTIVVGVDFGGVIGAELAARSDRVAGLVLMSTALGAAWLPSRIAAHEPLAGPLYRWSAGQRFLGAADPSGELARAFPPDPGLSDRMLCVARGLDVGRMRAVRGRLANGGELARGIPILCLWGASDPFFPTWSGRRLARLLGAAWAELPGRHALAWTAPDQVSDVLSAWAARV